MKKSLLVLLCVCFLSLMAWGANAPDPLKIGIGARGLGLGRSFTAMGDDVTCMYANPAGLTSLKEWQVTSMSGKLLDEYNYQSVSGAIPTNFGTVGIGFVGANIGGAKPTTLDAFSRVIVDTSQPEMAYFNNVYVLSYASAINRFLKWDPVKNMTFGINYKIFSVGLSGDGITKGSANGMELDAGVLYPVKEWLTLGLNAQNLLPYSSGGKLTYASGHAEAFPALVRLGGAVKVLGPVNALKASDQKLDLLIDLEQQVSRKNYPFIYRAGIEWSPIGLLAIRLGLDQVVVAENNGTKAVAISNFTAGLGLTYQKFRFDYAYYQMPGTANVANQYFSLSYGLPTDKIVYLVVDAPLDKSIVYQDIVRTSGKVRVPDVAKLIIAGTTEAVIAKTGAFKEDLMLVPGKNPVWYRAFSKANKVVAEIKLRVLRLLSFPDVPENYWAKQQIGVVATLGIIQGYPDGKFKPEGEITRAEMATLLIKAAGYPEGKPGQSSFKDMKLDHWAGAFINKAYEMGVIEGYPDKTFRPKGNITRAEGLAMIARFAKIEKATYNNDFVDVFSNHWIAPTLAGAKAAGMLQYLGDKDFEPNKQLARAEVVEILFRTPFVKDLYKDLLDFTKGY